MRRFRNGSNVAMKRLRCSYLDTSSIISSSCQALPCVILIFFQEKVDFSNWATNVRFLFGRCTCEVFDFQGNPAFTSPVRMC